MSKVFNLWFDFENHTYMVLVTMIIQSSETVFYVDLRDRPLLEIIPTRKIVYHTKHGVMNPSNLDEVRVCDLVLVIAEAIYRHLSTHHYNKK